ncbi:MAG: exodeoxyribonuclease III [Candidatus Methylopumilus sp.]|nr:exodeoxyribonuclease III [Candidatus Methylopumilus sp.]
MKLATWNVNSLTVRIGQVEEWIKKNQPDLLLIQETKQDNTKFPHETISALGYKSIHNGQKTYNGVAIISKYELYDVQNNIPQFEDEQKRFIAATINTEHGKIRVVCVYVPNGQSVDSEKYHYKLNWLNYFIQWLKNEMKMYPDIIIAGDFNIAPQDIDCHDPEAWKHSILVSQKEREAFQKILDLKLLDSFRKINPNEIQYSWWDYRMGGFRRNLGMRIDHILMNKKLADMAKLCVIDKEPRKYERPSDHAPVMVEM